MEQKPQIEYIVLACCTCMRPKMLKNCLDSIRDLVLPDGIKTEILVIDNDKNESARAVIEEYNRTSSLCCHYVCEEKRGLVYARNRLLEEALKLGASHVMLFDDDEILTQNALTEHIKLYNTNKDALISSGIVLNKFEEKAPNYIKKNIAFKQKTTRKTGQIKTSCASGNVFFPAEMLKDGLRFSEKYIFMGGEDGDFFGRASKLGYTIVQNSDSLLYESVTEARANLRYILKKSYYNGFAASYFKFQKNNKKLKKYFYVFKQLITLVFDLLLIIPSIIFGLTGFWNLIAMTVRTTGKITGALQSKPISFYNTIYGE